MTRLERLISIIAFAVAFVVLFGVASAVSGNLGPVEFIVVLALAIPVGMLIGRLVRSALRSPRGST
ncbi:MAG: hypothetical protein QOH83_101 [Solirubrobacteraceae bacterium]|nr:hypothetical protein [Solirubrobacteraceae bacterium]